MLDGSNSDLVAEYHYLRWVEGSPVVHWKDESAFDFITTHFDELPLKLRKHPQGNRVSSEARPFKKLLRAIEDRDIPLIPSWPARPLANREFWDHEHCGSAVGVCPLCPYAPSERDLRAIRAWCGNDATKKPPWQKIRILIFATGVHPWDYAHNRYALVSKQLQELAFNPVPELSPHYLINYLELALRRIVVNQKVLAGKYPYPLDAVESVARKLSDFGLDHRVKLDAETATSVTCNWLWFVEWLETSGNTLFGQLGPPLRKARNTLQPLWGYLPEPFQKAHYVSDLEIAEKYLRNWRDDNPMVFESIAGRINERASGVPPKEEATSADVSTAVTACPELLDRLSGFKVDCDSWKSIQAAFARGRRSSLRTSRSKGVSFDDGWGVQKGSSGVCGIDDAIRVWHRDPQDSKHFYYLDEMLAGRQSDSALVPQCEALVSAVRDR